MELGEAVYYSRSRQEIWHKGATSGHVQKVKQILIDCDQDALIVLVDPCGAGACHTGHHSCFYRSVPFGDELKAPPQGEPVTLREACLLSTSWSVVVKNKYRNHGQPKVRCLSAPHTLSLIHI